MEIGAGVPAHCDVASAGCFVSERAMTDGSVEVASAAQERSKTISRAASAGGVTQERLKPTAVLSKPSVLQKRAPSPLAVLLSPLVL